MVQIQSSWFPLADRNPQQFLDIYHASDADFLKEKISIYHWQNLYVNSIISKCTIHPAASYGVERKKRIIHCQNK